MTKFKYQVNPPMQTPSDIENGVSKIHYRGRDNATSPLSLPPKYPDKAEAAPESNEHYCVSCKASNVDTDDVDDLEVSNEIRNSSEGVEISDKNLTQNYITTVSIEKPDEDNSDATNETHSANDHTATTSNEHPHENSRISLSNESLDNITPINQQESNASLPQNSQNDKSENHALAAKDSEHHIKDHEPKDKSCDSPSLPDSIAIAGPPSAKDRGYAWVICFNVFLINLVCAGYVKSFGITYTLIMDYFPDSPAATSGLIMGLLVGCRGLLAAVAGAFSLIAGPRCCIMIGIFLSVCGLLMAIPAISIPYLAFTLGAVVGTGICMAETPGYILVTDYFFEKRPLSNGFRAAGNPMGGVIFSPLVVYLEQQFGLQGLFIILAGVMFQLLVSGMLMRPFEQHEKLVNYKYWMKMRNENNITSAQINQAKEKSDKKAKKKRLDFSFLCNPAYLVYLFVVLFASCALPNALLYLPLYGRSIGLSDFENSAVASFTSCADVAMRIFCGFLFSRKKVNRRYGFIAGLATGGAGCIIVPLCSNMWHLLIFATMFSLCMAFYWTLLNVLLADQFGGDAMASTYGFFRMTQGLTNFFYPSVIGFVMDASGGLTAPFLMMGSMLILGALVFTCQPLVAKLPGSKINLS